MDLDDSQKLTMYGEFSPKNYFLISLHSWVLFLHFSSRSSGSDNVAKNLEDE